MSDVSFRTTKIQSFDKVIHTIPNGLIDIVSNYTKGLYIANVQIEVNQDIEPQRVIEVLNKALEEIKKRDDISGADASVGGIASMHDGLLYTTSTFLRRGEMRTLYVRIIVMQRYGFFGKLTFLWDGF